MAVHNVEVQIKGSSEASVTPIRIMAVSAKLSGKSESRQGQPQQEPKKKA